MLPPRFLRKVSWLVIILLSSEKISNRQFGLAASEPDEDTAPYDRVRISRTSLCRLPPVTGAPAGR